MILTMIQGSAFMLWSEDINGDGKLDILNGNKKGVIVFWGQGGL